MFQILQMALPVEVVSIVLRLFSSGSRGESALHFMADPVLLGVSAAGKSALTCSLVSLASTFAANGKYAFMRASHDL